MVGVPLVDVGHGCLSAHLPQEKGTKRSSFKTNPARFFNFVPNARLSGVRMRWLQATCNLASYPHTRHFIRASRRCTLQWYAVDQVSSAERLLEGLSALDRCIEPLAIAAFCMSRGVQRGDVNTPVPAQATSCRHTDGDSTEQSAPSKLETPLKCRVLGEGGASIDLTKQLWFQIHSD
jgi:hypothetical protein